jgi:hypothetical protein
MDVKCMSLLMNPEQSSGRMLRPYFNIVGVFRQRPLHSFIQDDLIKFVGAFN